MSLEILAAVHTPGLPEFRTMSLTLDEPREDEVLVEIKAAGLCHTDVIGVNGGFKYSGPIVFGHEGAGIVRKVGSLVTGFAPGDRVLLTFRSCRGCRKCASGHPAYCLDFPQLNYAGSRIDGSTALHDGEAPVGSNFFGQSSFATHALTYPENLVPLPESISYEVAAPFGCAVQTGVGSIINSLACPPSSTLIIAGAGPVGLSAVMGAKIAQCATVLVLEPDARRRQLSLELGATAAFDPLEHMQLAEAIRDIEPSGFEFGLDTTGREEVLEILLGSLGPQGCLGCVGIGHPESRLPGTLNGVMKYGHQIIGIIEGDSNPQVFLPKLFEAYLSGSLPVDRMISSYPFSAINQASSEQSAGRCVKAVLTF